MITIEAFLAQAAWRLRAYLPCSPTDSTEGYLQDLWEAEHEAARYQLPQFAASVVRSCAHTDPSGLPCSRQAITPPIHGFLIRQPNVKHIHKAACRPFYGALCEQHLLHLVVPPASWWPEWWQEAEDQVVMAKVVLV